MCNKFRSLLQNLAVEVIDMDIQVCDCFTQMYKLYWICRMYYKAHRHWIEKIYIYIYFFSVNPSLCSNKVYVYLYSFDVCTGSLQDWKVFIKVSTLPDVTKNKSPQNFLMCNNTSWKKSYYGFLLPRLSRSSGISVHMEICWQKPVI